MTTCKNCGKPIVQGEPTPDPYWYHPHNQNVRCDLTRTANSKRAVPK